MTEPSENAPSSAENRAKFEERLDQAQSRRRAKDAPARSVDGTAMGIGMRLSAELVVATVIGGLLGYSFDWALGTSPWLLITMVLVGAAAGVKNMLRATEELNLARDDASRGEANDEE